MLKQMDGTPPEREPILNTPALVSWTIGVLCGIYLLQMILPQGTSSVIQNSFGVIPGRYFGVEPLPPTILPGAWGRLVPLLTYAFLHGGPVHLLMNVAWLLAIGTPVAQRLGTSRFLIFCAVTAIAAAAFYLFIKPASTVPMIGASGAISGLFGALARFIFGQSADGRSPITDRRVLFFAATWLGLNVVIGLSGLGTEDGVSSIAWEAHVGGFIAGLLLFPFFDRRPERFA